MITSDRMAAVDRNAEALGVPRSRLMESSGNAIARTVRGMVDSGASVAILCGRGNNGGDGFVAARFLDGYAVSVHLIGAARGITTDIARANWEALESGGYDLIEHRDSSGIDLPSCDVIVDALVGTGISAALREPVASAARAINAHSAEVVSVDVPSGMDADTGEAAGVVVDPDRVVTFHDEKPGLVDLGVPVTVADIGIPHAAELFVGPGDLRAIERDEAGHKGDSGRVLVVGGGPYTGAPALSAFAALRTGADLGTVACPAGIADSVASFGPDLIVDPFDGDRLEPSRVDDVLDAADGADCVVLGPGLGEDPATSDAVAGFLSRYGGRCVVDADALSVVPESETAASLICTPHQGELADMGGGRASDWRERTDTVERYAADLGHTFVVKGPHDVISDGERTRVNRTGNPGMTVGGTGDVLAGVIAALYAAPLDDPLEAGAVGAYVTGAAGDRAATDRGYGLIASDVVDTIPAVIWGESRDR